MARIRTIKPEFPQSESIGRLTRDARLLFIQLWTIVDDEGRSRAASRMLASLLYPYDDDAREHMTAWLAELERNELIRVYNVDGAHYLEITNWLKHQKIDRPSKSRLPAFVEGSRILANDREASATDLGPSTLDLGPSEANASGADAPPDPRGDLFKRGLASMVSMTGKPESRCRQLLGKWLRDCDDEAIHVLAAIDEAAADRVVDPVPWIERRLKPKFNRGTMNGQTAKDQSRDAFRSALGQLREFSGDSDLGGSTVRVLPAPGRG